MNHTKRIRFHHDEFPDFVDFINSYPDMRVWGNHLEFMKNGKTVRKVRLASIAYAEDYKKCVLEYRAKLNKPKLRYRAPMRNK